MAKDYYESARAWNERKGNIYSDSLCRKRAARAFARDMEGCKTPDGGVYNKTCVYEAMEGMLD